MTTETITWTQAGTPPDADRTVLLHMPGADDPVWLGYWDGDRWLLVDGMPAPAVAKWADLPTGERNG